MITYHQLRTFLAVARTGSLTRAARQLASSQPTVSLQLRALAHFLEIPLLERHDGRLRLTPAGEKLRTYAEEALAGLRVLQQDVESLRGSLAGPLAVGATYVMSRYVLPSAVSRFLDEHPGVDLQLHVEFAEPLFGELLANALDVVVYINVPAPAGLTTEVLCDEEFVILGSPRHPLAAQRPVTPAELSAHPFVAPASSSFREMIEAKLQAAGVTPRAVAEGRHHDSIKRLVERNVGYSLVIRTAVADELASGRLVALPLAGPPITTELVMAFRSRPAVSPLVRAFVQFVRDDLRASRPGPVGPPALPSRAAPPKGRHATPPRRRGARRR